MSINNTYFQFFLSKQLYLMYVQSTLAILDVIVLVPGHNIILLFLGIDRYSPILITSHPNSILYIPYTHSHRHQTYTQSNNHDNIHQSLTNQKIRQRIYYSLLFTKNPYRSILKLLKYRRFYIDIGHTYDLIIQGPYIIILCLIVFGINIPHVIPFKVQSNILKVRAFNIRKQTQKVLFILHDMMIDSVR